MASASVYICQQCGYESGKWFGKCPQCDRWGTLVETVATAKIKKPFRRTRSKSKSGGSGGNLISLASVPIKSTKRTLTNISELDRVLGGGLVAGQVILIAGEPGIGKSTILLQVADKLGSVLYVSGEESVGQIKIRANRLGVKKKSILIMEETDIDSVINTGQQNSSKTLIVDSIQTMYTSDLSGMAGSVGQVRECTYRLIRLAKSLNVTIFIAGHVTKGGTVAGPAVLSHLVDTVLWFEGDKSLTFRMLRAVKNRFGPTDEIGIFSMQEKGLVPLKSPDKHFLSKGSKKIAGNVVCSVLQGTRPLLVEIQALVVPTKLAYPRRIAQGIDPKRLELLLAVLTRRCALPLYDYDCFVNVAGGISVKNDPSADLAICLSIVSALKDKALDKNSIAVGEVGLLADIREVVAQEKRIKEAKRLGFTNPITNKSAKYLQQVIANKLS